MDIRNAFECGIFESSSSQAKNHWNHGPLELVFLDQVPVCERSVFGLLRIGDWNWQVRGGAPRFEDTRQAVKALVPVLCDGSKPKPILVPRSRGYTELHLLLASVVPEPILDRHGIPRMPMDLHLGSFLLPFCRDDFSLERIQSTETAMQKSIPEYFAQKAEAAGYYARAASQAFQQFIWTNLFPDRFPRYFHRSSTLRVFSGDDSYWMNRLYRLALEWNEELAEEEPGWDDGLWLWHLEKREDREEVVRRLLDGDGIVDNLLPVLEVLHRHPTHEDFSDQYSWIKEDFERSFYHKRSKRKITLLEMIDDTPAWSIREPGSRRVHSRGGSFEEVIFRDLLALFDPRDQHLIIAVREAKTLSEIACELGHRGHAAVSRRWQAIKIKLRRVLEGDR